MARPKKKGVDYFPHNCVTGKTIFILEQRFKNDGYAFWFKLLEFLGTKEDHVLDCNNVADMEFLQAKTHLDEVSVLKILDLLANLEAIDADLWKQRQVWSQGFVDGISDVYVNRRMKTPSKPSFYSSKQQVDDISTSKSTQSKVKESKEKESNTAIGAGPVVFLKAMRDRYVVCNPNYSASDEDFSAMFEILDFIRGQTGIERKIYELPQEDELAIQVVWDSWIPVIVKKFINKSLSEIAKFKKTEISNMVKNGVDKKTKAEKNGDNKGVRFSEDYSEVIFSDETTQPLNEDQRRQAQYGMINPRAIVKGILN